jgi:hypothetical protein
MSDDIKPVEEGAPVREGVNTPAADPAVEPSPSSSNNNSPDELDQLLAEYDQGMKSALADSNLAAPDSQQQTEQHSTLDELDSILHEVDQPVDAVTQQRFETQSRELQALREQ